MVALLRAVNVGGKNRVAMADLRGLATRLGLADPITYVQSGNVVVTTSLTPAALEHELAAAIHRELHVTTVVMVRTARELAAISAADPYVADEQVATKRVTVFLTDVPAAAAAASLAPDRFAPDRFALRGRELYLHLPDGMGRARFSMPVVERAFGVQGTARNATTVSRLAELASA